MDELFAADQGVVLNRSDLKIKLAYQINYCEKILSCDECDGDGVIYDCQNCDNYFKCRCYGFIYGSIVCNEIECPKCHGAWKKAQNAKKA